MMFTEKNRTEIRTSLENSELPKVSGTVDKKTWKQGKSVSRENYAL